jgi:hypothetical protein
MLTIKRKVMEFFIGVMEGCIKDNGKMGNKTEEVHL